MRCREGGLSKTCPGGRRVTTDSVVLEWLEHVGFFWPGLGVGHGRREWPKSRTTNTGSALRAAGQKTAGIIVNERQSLRVLR